jgi:hypothetical protein
MIPGFERPIITESAEAAAVKYEVFPYEHIRRD